MSSIDVKNRNILMPGAEQDPPDHAIRQIGEDLGTHAFEECARKLAPLAATPEGYQKMLAAVTDTFIGTYAAGLGVHYGAEPEDDKRLRDLIVRRFTETIDAAWAFGARNRAAMEAMARDTAKAAAERARARRTAPAWGNRGGEE